MSIFDIKFSTGQVVAATGVLNENLQNWIKRDLIIGQKSIEGGGAQGRHRQFSLFNLMEIAIAKAIIDVGGMADLKDVFRAANHFAHTGPGPLPGQPARCPSLPFNVPNSKTLVIAGRGWSNEILFTAADSALHLSTKLLERGGCVVIDASEVFWTVLRRAGIDPIDVMREGYEN